MAKRKMKRKKLAKKKTKKPAPKRQSFWIPFGAYSILALMLCLSVMFFAWRPNKQQVNDMTRSNPMPVFEVESLREMKEEFGHWLDPENPEDAKRIQDLTNFYWETLDAPIRTMVLDGKFYIPETNERIKFLLQQIYDRFGKHAVINPVWNYAPGGSKNISAQANILNGDPLCQLFLPVIEERRSSYKGTGVAKWQEAFFNDLVGTIEHELEHLALSRFPEFDLDNSPLTPKEKLLGEAEVWHNSMLYVYEPLMKRSMHLDSRTIITYDAWKNGGEKSDSPSWLRFIELYCLGN